MRRIALAVGSVGPLVMAAAVAWGAPPPTPAGLVRGKTLYEEACATCHGSDGKGQGTGLRQEVPLPDFTWCAFAAEEPDQDWIHVVAEDGRAGGRSPEMPAFADALTQEEIVLVVAYLRTFCTEDWPRGELNFPRPLVTDKAFPENEVVLTWQTGHTPDREQQSQIAAVLEKRVGARGQVELKLPFNLRSPESQGTLGGVGDVGLGAKYVLYHSLPHLAIVSGGAELTVPTGSIRRGLGEGTTTLGPFLALGKAWGDLVGQGFLQVEIPFAEHRAPKTFLYNLALSYPVLDPGRGTEAHLFLELNGQSEWGTESPRRSQLYVTPGLRKGLTAAGNWAVAVGVQVPVTGVREVDYRVVGYLLYEFPPFR